MVKIIGKSLKELAIDERTNKLEKITQEVCGEKFKINRFLKEDICLHDKELTNSKIYHPTINVNTSFGFNRINVYNDSYLNEAIKLAEAYEASGESEFTVKKNYNE